MKHMKQSVATVTSSMSIPFYPLAKTRSCFSPNVWNKPVTCKTYHEIQAGFKGAVTKKIKNQGGGMSLPSGYVTFRHGKSPFLIGKPSISMGHLYHGYVSHNQVGSMAGSQKKNTTGSSLDHHFLSHEKKTNGFVWKCCVPLNPMVLLIIIPIKWLFHWEDTPFSDIPKVHESSPWKCPRKKPWNHDEIHH